MDMNEWGWTAAWQQAFEDHERAGRIPGRVLRLAARQLELATPWGEMTVAVASDVRAAVGDWVAVDPVAARAEAMLPRRSHLSRRRPGKASQNQVMATNVDVAFVLTALDDDFSVRRIERYVTLAAAGGVEAVAVLTKADLCPDVPSGRAEVERVAGGRDVLVTSVLGGQGVESVRERLPPGVTGVLLGSSGVGKSTLLNALLGHAHAATAEIAADGRGRHTTTHRELFALPRGGLLVDVPGLREVGVVGEETDVEAAFDDVAALAEACRFRDCAHGDEPGCAVREAVDRGELDPARLDSYHALRREAAAHERLANERLKRAHERSTEGRWRRQVQARRKRRGE